MKPAGRSAACRTSGAGGFRRWWFSCCSWRRTLVVFVWPLSDAPRRTDLVAVLGAWQQLTRPATAVALVRRYPETPLLISVYDLGECPRLQQVTGDPKAVCFLPYPFTTRGEA